MRADIPLVPKNADGKARVIVMGRLSQPKETELQTQQSIESSYEPVKDFLKKICSTPMEIRFLGEQISGLLAERDTVLEAWDLIDTGDWDLVIGEDLGRFYRNPRHQMIFVQDCVDADIRCICLADNLDTADEQWEMMLGVGALRHGMHIPDTRRRIKRAATYSFQKGGMAQKVKFGYRKLTPMEAQSGNFGPVGLREVKESTSTPILHEIRRQALEHGDASTIVDWLKKEGISPGPYVQCGWRVAILKSLLCDPKLHGCRLFRRTSYRLIYKTGHSKRQKNANPDKAHVPELAYMTLEEQESMVAALGWCIDWNNSPPSRDSPRKKVPRKDSYWPGQAAACAICEVPKGMLIMGDHLRCRNSKKLHGHTCWNRVQAPIELLRQKTVPWMLEQIRQHPVAYQVLLDAAWDEFQQRVRKADARHANRRQEIESLKKQQANLTEAIALGGQMRGLLDKLAAVEARLRELHAAKQEDSADSDQMLQATSRDELAANLEAAVLELVRTSYAFARVLRQYLRVEIQPVQDLDSGQVRPRAKVQLLMGGNVKDNDSAETIEAAFDLFEPPAHIRYMPQAVAAHARESRPTLRQIGEEIGTSYMTVKRALAYDRRMKELGVENPYVEITEPPANAPRWKNRK